MRYARLGKTWIEVSTIAFGGYGISGRADVAPPSEEDARAAVRTAFDEGVTFFVTADSEGDGLGERRIGAALADVRGKVVLSTKTGPERQPPRELALAVDRSLKNFGTDVIDLYMVDLPHPRLPVADIMDQLERIRLQGKIRAFGVCRYGVQDLSRVLKCPVPPCSLEISYNLLFRAAEAEVLPICVRQQVAVLCREPLMLGLLAGLYARPEDIPAHIARSRHFNHARAGASHGQAGFEKETFETLAAIRRIADELGEPVGTVALAWLHAQKGVISTIVGSANAIEARRNARSGNLMIPPGVADQLTKATKGLKDRMGKSVDLWNVPPLFS